MFKEKVRQFILIATAVEGAVITTVLAIHAPSDAWLVWNGIYEALPAASGVVAIGMISMHLLGKNSSLVNVLTDAGLAMCLVGATFLARWLSARILLPFENILPLSGPIRLFGGLKLFVVLYMVVLTISIPALFYATALVLNTLWVFDKKQRNKVSSQKHSKCNAHSIPCAVDISIKHKFPCANAAHRLKVEVRDSIQNYLRATFGDTVRHAIKWSGEDLSTVTIEVSFGDSKKPDDPNAIVLGLTECLAQIDAKDQEAERAQADLV